MNVPRKNFHLQGKWSNFLSKPIKNSNNIKRRMIIYLCHSYGWLLINHINEANCDLLVFFLYPCEYPVCFYIIVNIDYKYVTSMKILFDSAISYPVYEYFRLFFYFLNFLDFMFKTLSVCNIIFFLYLYHRVSYCWFQCFQKTEKKKNKS